MPLLVSGMQEHKNTGALFIYQDAAIYGGKLQKGVIIKDAIKHQAYVLLTPTNMRRQFLETFESVKV